MQHDWQTVQQAALGQWPELLQAFGVPFRPKEKAGPCPRCGGTDRAHMKQREGRVMLYCRHCGTHWGDELLLELAFGGDFNRMCNELGEWLHCQPAERQQMARTQAKVAQASSGDQALIAKHIESAARVAELAQLESMSQTILRYGLDCQSYSIDGMEGCAVPMRLSGQVIDWIWINQCGEEVMEGEPVPGARVVFKPEGEPKARVIISPFLTDAAFLFNCSRRANLVLCSGTLKNLRHVAEAVPERYEVVLAIPYTLDALEAIQTMPYRFMMPAEIGAKFCSVECKHRPKAIHEASEAGRIYMEMIDHE